MVYLAMTGLNATMERMTAVANNLANASTTAFKSQLPQFKAHLAQFDRRASIGSAVSTTL